MKQLNYCHKIYFTKILLSFFLSVLVIIDSYGQVNLQTGSATFSLPMFNWQDNKSRINTLVALSYNSGNGLRVNDVASNVGQGWSLVAGGVITRMQLGEPDDQVAFGNASEKDERKYPNGILHATIPAANGCPVGLTNYPIYGSKNQLYAQHNIVAEDKQLDYFSFQFNGKAGLFVLDGNGNKGVSLGDSKMVITFQKDLTLLIQGVRTVITSFTIQDVDGLIYKFTRHGKTKVLKAEYTDKDLTEKLKQPEFKNEGVYHQAGFEHGQYHNPWVINCWYLTEIEDVLTHRKVTFNYEDRDISNSAGEDISYSEGKDRKGDDKNYVIITHKNSITRTPEISSIAYPDGHSVVFHYGEKRADLNEAKALSSVDISYQGRFLSKYLLKTTYFILNRYGTPVSAFQKKMARLCLKSVQKIGVDLKEDTPPYIFDYYTGSNATDDFVPPPFFYAKDVWGYYNGNSSKAFNNADIILMKSISELSYNELKGLCFLRNNASGLQLNPKTGYAKNGLLRQIIYPTGGTLSYEYEQNTGAFEYGHGINPQNTTNVVVGGVHVSQTSATDGGYSNGCATPVTTGYKYVLGGSTSQSSLWGLEMPDHSMEMRSYYEPEFKTWRWRGGIFGECYYKFLYPGILSQSQAITLEGFQKFMETWAPVLGVVSIVTTIVDVVSLVCVSSGVFAWVAVIVDVAGALVTLILTCTSDMSSESVSTVYYNSDLNGVSPLPVQFKRVEVVESTGGIGRTVHEFTSKDDYAIWHETNPAFAAKQRFAPWAYGLPKLTTVYDVNGNPVKQTENIYNFNTVYAARCPDSIPHYDRRLLLRRPLNLLSAKCQVMRSISQRNTHWSDWASPAQYNDPDSYRTTSNSDLSVDLYDLYTGRVELNKVYERVFKPNSPTDYVETVSEYFYNDENFEVSSTKTLQSDGTYRQKNIYYTIDFIKAYGACYALSEKTTNNAELKTLVQNNIISLPVESNEMVSNGSTFNYTDDKATVFTTLANGDIKPLKVLEGRFSKPENRNSPWPSDYDNFSYSFPGALYDPENTDYSFYKVAQTFTYDASGNLTGIKDEGSRVVHNIYDYNDKYIAASVINADPVLDQSAYCSFETNSFGGWSLSGAGHGYISNAITGTRAFALNSNTLSANINTTKPYVLSFWATNSSVIVSGGATLVKSAPVYNGFTYYEYAIAQGTSSVSVSGNATIDELRLYPKSARMRTVTYDPLIGKTSECDENNRITYYEYDNLGRMQLVKDENKSILKMYEYNNISAAKQNGCPAVYYNRQATEFFTKSNCSTGYLGGNTSYTVPANKYTSSISQEDADAKAEDELFEYGQAAADASNAAGSCILLYYNDLQSKAVTTESCGPGYVGGSVTYTVPAGKYFSTISKEDANQKALVEIAANADAYANSPDYAVCNYSTTPDWTAEEGAQSYCQVINGTTHMFVLFTDINPNSSSYMQTQWHEVDPATGTCPAGYYNTVNYSGYYYSQNCSGNETPIAIYISKPAGSTFSTISEADANNKAAQEAQNEANTLGICQGPPVELTYTNNSYRGWSIEFYNTTTGQTTFLTANYQGSGSLGILPEGSYNITFHALGSGSNQYFTAGCSGSGTGNDGFTLTSVSISSGCSTININ